MATAELPSDLLNSRDNAAEQLYSRRQQMAVLSMICCMSGLVCIMALGG